MHIDLSGHLSAALRALDAAIDGDELAIAQARAAARVVLALSDAAIGPWMAIDDNAANGEDMLLYFPLEGLADYNARIVIGHWRKDATNPVGGQWVFQNRAVRGYSNGYQPTHYQPLLPPIS